MSSMSSICHFFPEFCLLVVSFIKLIEAEIDLKTKGAYVASVALSFEAMGRLGNGNIC